MTSHDHVDTILAQWARERPDLDSSPIGVIGRISRAARSLERELETAYRLHGLDGGTYDVLATLRRSGPALRALGLGPGRRHHDRAQLDDEQDRSARGTRASSCGSRTSWTGAASACG